MAEIINYNSTIEVVSQNDTYILQKEDLIIIVNATKIIFQQAKFNLELNYTEITSPATANITALKVLINGYLDDTNKTNLEKLKASNTSLKTFAYYTGIVAGNPSGNKNVQTITYTSTGLTTAVETFAYDSLNDVLTITLS